jgi:hypothetical protein
MSRIVIFLAFIISVIFIQKNSSAQDLKKEPEKKVWKEKDAIKFNFNEDGSHYFQVTFLNQVWMRFNESNDGTTVQGKSKDNTFDIGLRRTRIQMFSQVTDKVFVYFQFGMNNFNAMFNSSGGNRKLTSFFHDAVCEYKVTKGNQLKLGGGLTIANGLSRFSQPSVSSIMTMDVPVFAQATVDQTDEFSRKLSVYARGQLWKFDYRFVLSDPFPITSSGVAIPAISKNAAFSPIGHTLQYQGHVMYQFFEHEGHTTPYMTGTYLGNKKVFNIGGGYIIQKDAMWYEKFAGDTSFSNMMLFCVESFLDMPVNKEKGTAVSAYIGYYNTNYGNNYLRYNGIMNPANGTTNENEITKTAYGNSFPMFGTGQVIYSQFGFLLPKNLLGEKGGQLMPYASITHASFDRLNGKSMDVFNLGMNWLIKGHKAKLSLDYQNRPTYATDSNNNIFKAGRKSCATLQFQIFI